jgi:hypothetical protein
MQPLDPTLEKQYRRMLRRRRRTIYGRRISAVSTSLLSIFDTVLPSDMQRKIY